MECIFSEPRTFDNSPAETKQDFWQYSKMTCDENFEILVENPINSEADFRLIKEYSFGEITTILLMGIILFFVVFLTLKKLFFHDTTRIHTISQKKF